MSPSITPRGVFLMEECKMAKKKNQINERITLACTVCQERNYATTKNKKNNPERLEINKFCPRCKKTTKHKETK